MKHNQSNFEAWLTENAGTFPYPPTPDLTHHIQTSLSHTTHHAPRLRNRLALALTIALLIFATLLAVPPVRAGIFRFLNIGSINIFLEQTPLPTVDPIALPNLPGKTTLATAQNTASFPIVLPPALGDPDYVFQYNQVGEAVTLVWADEHIVWQILNNQMIGNKLQPESTTTTFVANRVAIWITGDHLLTLYDQHPGTITGMTRLVAGNVLIWQDGDITYRLEIDADMATAKELAESIYESR
jgi:hypothetical protein